MRALLLLGILCGCPGETPTKPDAGQSDETDSGEADSGDPTHTYPVVCPRPNAAPVPADINGDGVADVADPIALYDHLFRGGRAPVCTIAADFDRNDYVEMDDGNRISTYLVAGTQRTRILTASHCNDSVPWPEGSCGPLALELTGPARTTESRFTVQAVVQSPVLAIQGFSMSLSANQCTIARVSNEGTPAAEIWDDPPGLRHLGFSTTTLVEGGAIAYLVLSLTDDVTLPPGGAFPILTLEIEAQAPSSGCTRCTISTRDDLAWTGQPIETVLVAEGRSHRPAPATLEVDVCAE